jgi:hypothetical protein
MTTLNNILARQNEEPVEGGDTTLIEGNLVPLDVMVEQARAAREGEQATTMPSQSTASPSGTTEEAREAVRQLVAMGLDSIARRIERKYQRKQNAYEAFDPEYPTLPAVFNSIAVAAARALGVPEQNVGAVAVEALTADRHRAIEGHDVCEVEMSLGWADRIIEALTNADTPTDS